MAIKLKDLLEVWRDESFDIKQGDKEYYVNYSGKHNIDDETLNATVTYIDTSMSHMEESPLIYLEESEESQ